MTKVIINKWSAGIVNDPRTELEGAARCVTNFDVLSYPYKLKPYRDSENGDSGASTHQISNFEVALHSGTTYYLYGLGVVNGTSKANIFYKQLNTNGTPDLSDGGWGETANNASSSGTSATRLFVYYRSTGLIYGARAGSAIWAYDPSGGTGFADTSHSLSYTDIAQGLVHSKDNILYIPYDNKIAKNSSGSWTDVALSIPSQYKITSICEYGNYLAIGAAPLSGTKDQSTVYLWDRDSTLTTVSESINWGEGSLMVLEEIQGFLVGVSQLAGTQIRNEPRIAFKYYSEKGAQQFEQVFALSSGSASAQITNLKQKINNRVYFPMVVQQISGIDRVGIWSIGIQNARFNIVLERTPNNNTALTTPVLSGFIVVGDYLFQTYTDNGTFGMSKTNDQASFTASSIWESTINPNMPVQERTKKKQLVGVKLSYDPLPTSGQAVLYYKVDGGSWTEIFTETGDGTVTTESTQDVNKTNFTAGREYEFKIVSTGGVEPTELTYEYKILQTQI